MLSKYSVTQLLELSKLSKSYINQINNGKRPPSQKSLKILLKRAPDGEANKYYEMFLESRWAMGVNHKNN
jgi:transcriptional regulator with XRE-family HTH domain